MPSWIKMSFRRESNYFFLRLFFLFAHFVFPGAQAQTECNDGIFTFEGSTVTGCLSECPTQLVIPDVFNGTNITTVSQAAKVHGGIIDVSHMVENIDTMSNSLGATFGTSRMYSDAATDSNFKNLCISNKWI